MLPKNRPPTSPGEMLREEFLVPLELSQSELARRTGIPQSRISEIIAGKRVVTAETALLFGRVFGTTPDFWLNLQAHFSLWHAQQALKGVLAKMKPFSRLAG